MAKRQVDFQWVPDKRALGRFCLGKPIKYYNNLGLQFDTDCGYYWFHDYEYLYVYTDTYTNEETEKTKLFANKYIRDDDGRIDMISSDKYFYYDKINLIGKNTLYILSFMKSLFNLKPDVDPNCDDIVDFEKSDGTYQTCKYVWFFPLGINFRFYNDRVEGVTLSR